MRRAQVVALSVLAVLTFGSLAITGGYAWYLRSPFYRNACARRLTDALGLPSDIGQVVPRSRQLMEFHDVRVWLPQRRGEAACCHIALVRQTPTADDPEAFELELRGGHSEISTRTWLGDDYRFVLESGLRPGFDPAGPRRVVFTGMDLTFERDQFEVALSDASGTVSFTDPHRGQAGVTCSTFNGYAADQPVVLRSVFSPQRDGIRLDRVELAVPELPIAIIGLNELAGLDLQTGAFNGQLTYSESDDGRDLVFGGKLLRLQLSECTAGFVATPWCGSVPELELAQATVHNGKLQRLEFRGLFTSMVLGDVLALWGLEKAGGRMDLYVSAAEISSTGIEHFVASGICDDISLAALSQALGWGQMTGTAKLAIDDLTITADHITSFDAELTVAPSADHPNTIDRALVVEILNRAFNITLPDAVLRWLPERFEYSELGVRCEIRDETLYVLGTHGPGERVILSMPVGGASLPIIQAPEQPIDLTAALDRLRATVRARVAEHLETITPHDAWRAISKPRPRAPQPGVPRDNPPPE